MVDPQNNPQPQTPPADLTKEEINEFISNYETHMKILYSRKISLEQELAKIEANEKSKYINYQNLERLCQHVNKRF